MIDKKLIDKEAFKKSQGKCYMCPVDDYACLHCHRILPGEDGGVYDQFNTLCVCANCHAKIHDGQIVIDRKYLCTSGQWVLHFWENGQEQWK